MPIGWIVAAVVAVVAGGLSYKAAKDAQKAARKAQDEFAGVLVNKDSNIEPIPVIYGERRIGGTRVYVHTEGTDNNQYLYMAIVLCEGEIEDIHSIEIDDYAIDEGRYGTIETHPSPATNQYRVIYRSQEATAENWVYIEGFFGKDDQPASGILSTASNWGANHKLSGVAYLAVRLQWDPDVFSGIPNITAVVKGRKIYDPRTSTTAWSDNPALCIRDYLTNTRYGKGLATSVIDSTSFEDAADDLDNFTVTPYSGGPTGVKLFKCNAIINTGDEIFKNLGDMLLGCKGFLPYQNGKYYLYIDQSVSTSVITLDTSTIIGGIAIKSERKEDKFNRVVCKFPNPETKWEPDQAIWPDSGSTEETSFLSADGSEVLVEEIDLPTITNYYAARDFARIFCLRSRNALRCSLQATSEALNLRIGDRVSVTHPTPGWTAKPFQVEELTLNYDGTVSLQLVEYDSTIYAYDPASEEQTYSDTDLPDPFTVGAPSSLSATAGIETAADGSAIPYINISFTASDDKFIEKYVISVVPSSSNRYEVTINTDDLTNAQITGSSAIGYLLQPVFLDTYTIKVRAHNSAGVRSTAITATVNVSGDTTAPSAPTWASTPLYAGIKSIGLNWTNPSESDFAYVQAERKTTGASDVDYIVVAKVYGAAGESASHVDTGLADNQSYTYRLFAYDWSNNKSDSADAQSLATLDTLVNEVGLEPLNAHGYVYWQTPQASAPSGDDLPTATDYDFDADPNTNPITGLTAGWDINPPTPSTNTATSGLPYWVARYHAYEDSVGGSTSVDFSSPFQSTVFDGLVTFQNLNTELAKSGTSLVTQIDGGRIRTGQIDLANENQMAIMQGKSAAGLTNTGFWLGNDGGTAEFWLGSPAKYMYWDGTSLVSTGLTIQATDGTVLLDADGLRSAEGNNLLYNGRFVNGSNGWSTSGTVSFSSTLGTAETDAGEYIQSQVYIPASENEPLYIYADMAGADAYGQIIFYKSDGTFAQVTVSGSSWSDSAGSSQAFRVAKVDYPSYTGNPYVYARVRFGTLSGGVTTTWSQVGVAKAPPVIDPAYASTYIRNASIDTAQIANLAVEEGKIDNLSVSTLKIQDNAVTIPEGASAGATGELGINEANATQLITKTISYLSTARPEAIIINAFGVMEKTQAQSGDIRLIIQIDGTTVFTSTQTVSSTGSTTVVATYIDTSVTGTSTTITLKAYKTGSGTGTDCVQSGLTILGAKK